MRNIYIHTGMTVKNVVLKAARLIHSITRRGFERSFLRAAIVLF